MTASWSNWSASVRNTPDQVVTPWTTASLQRVVETALAQGQKIKAVGSGHSFSPIAVADEVQVDLRNYTGIIALDQQTAQVTVRSGTKLWQIPQLLADTGLAMQNMGDINQQSIAGAISTSTHGTGITFGSLASQVVGLELLTGTGELLTVSARHNETLLNALRVTLGALGILTSITLQLVPEYDVHTVEQPATLDWVLNNWDALNTSHDHFEFFWFGHDSYVQTKTSQRLPVSGQNPSHAGRVRRWFVDEFVTNAGLAGICHLGRLNASWVPPLNRLSTRVWGRSAGTAHWSNAFISSRRVRFNEMEYALPFDTIPEVINELRRLFRRHDISSTFPLEVRAAAPDTAWLASNHQQKTGYIAVHQHFRQDYQQYFARIEPVLLAAGGRPHWGKLHTLDSQRLGELYPRWSEVLTLRDQLDPERSFTNAHLAQVLGA